MLWALLSLDGASCLCVLKEKENPKASVQADPGTVGVNLPPAGKQREVLLYGCRQTDTWVDGWKNLDRQMDG